MTISDEILMAYADGELNAATRASVEAAMQDDPEIRKRVAHHRALRETMRGAFSSVLDEPVPDRLIQAARGQSTAPESAVVDLSLAREARDQKNLTAPGVGYRPPWPRVSCWVWGLDFWRGMSRAAP
jgi:anti-sigma factor RsiW